MKIEDMRPGSLSKQYNVCGMPGCRCKDEKNPKKHGPYYNLSFTVSGKGGTKFIRRNFVEQIKKETAEYKRFKKLTDQWIDLSIQLSNLKIEEAKEKIDRTKEKKSQVS
jgi:hypothetical protein